MGKYTEWANERAAEIERIRDEGINAVMTSDSIPSATVGIFGDGFPQWKPNQTYKLNEVFYYDGKVGFCRQPSLVSNEVYPPFSTGTESLYGVRPIPDSKGIYPYVYNMAASVGMRVKDEEVYYCYNAIDVMLNSPAELPAHFRKEAE